MAATKPSPPRHDPKVVIALQRFAISITVFNILGYTLLGFEQPWLWAFIAVATGYTVEIGLELIGSRAEGRAPRFLGNGPRGVIEFLYPAHITSLAVNMLLYVNDRIGVMIFGVTVAVAAKWILRVPVKGRLRHYMNPSNFGITMVLLLFPWASIAPPYHFTENTGNAIDWLIPIVIIISGTALNAMLTGRMWLILAWLVVFALQSIVRGWLFDTSIVSALGTMTGVAFILYTNYMVTDPGTSPSKKWSQIAFGGGVALTYGVLTAAHVAYGLFLATAIVCLIRGLFLWYVHFRNKAIARQQAPALAVAGDAPATLEPVAAVTGPTAGTPVETAPEHREAKAA